MTGILFGGASRRKSKQATITELLFSFLLFEDIIFFVAADFLFAEHEEVHTEMEQ